MANHTFKYGIAILSILAKSLLLFFIFGTKPIPKTTELERSENTKNIKLSLHGKTIETPIYDEIFVIEDQNRTLNENQTFRYNDLFLGNFANNVLFLRTSVFHYQALAISDQPVEESCRNKKYRNKKSTLCYNKSLDEYRTKSSPSHTYRGIITINGLQYRFIIRGHPEPLQSLLVLKRLSDS